MRYFVAIVSLFVAFSVVAKAKDSTTPKPSQPQVVRPAPTPITFDQIDQAIKQFAMQGLHRAGSKVDRRTALILKQTLKRDGLDVKMDGFTFRRPISGGGMVSMKVDKINSRLMPGMPYLSSPSTGGVTRSGQLGFVGEDGKIPVIHLYVTPSSAKPVLRAKSLKQFKEAVASGRYPAVIGVTQGGYSGLVPLMIDLNQKYKTPAILLSSALGNFVEIYAEINNTIQYRTKIRYERAKAYNVVATVKGTDPTLKPLVVIASRSGWWTAAAERGAGVAAWLAVAKYTAQLAPSRTVIFVSTTGQEYYSLGLKEFMQAHAVLMHDAYGVIYIGANVGTKPKPNFIAQGSNRELRRLAQKAFDAHQLNDLRWAAPEPVLVTPLAPVFQRSGHALIFAATNNKCFRMTCDKWPSNVNVDATVSFAKALAQIVQQMSVQ